MLAWWLWDVLARNWALVAIVTTIATLVIIPALLIVKYVRISLNIMRSTKPPLSRSPLDFQRIDGEPVAFSAYDGNGLEGMIIRANPHVPRRGLVVFAHEYCSDMYSCARYCRPLQEIGYDIFAFDFRGHGRSECAPDYTPRQWVTDRELNDIRGAVAFARTWLVEQGRKPDIGLFGISRGGCAAVLAAAEDPDVRAVVCDGVYCTDYTIEYFMKRWAYIFAKVRVLYENHHPIFWRSLRWVMVRTASRSFKCQFPSVRRALLRMEPRPMFFIHGQRDSYLPVEQSRVLYALAPQPKSLWIAPEAKHNQAVVVHPERYAQLTVDFFNQHLGERVESSAPPRTTPARSVVPRPPVPAAAGR